MPEVLDQAFVKPILWLAPIIFILYKEKAQIKSIGITSKNLFSTLYLSIFLGAVFTLVAIFTNITKYGAPQFLANVGDSSFLILLSLSLVSTIAEEVAFRGYIFTRLKKPLGEWNANFSSSAMWAVINLPIYAFSSQMLPGGMVLWMLLMFVFGVGSAYVFARTKNILSSILLHIFWIWPIILFR